MERSLLQVRVNRKERVARDICRLELVDVAGRMLPSFSAGAHIDVHLCGALVRQYSLCNDPRERHRYVLGVQRDPQSRGGSSFIHDQTQVGDELSIGSPRNNFPLAAQASHSVLLAGGIGVTPLLSMAEELASSGQSFELHYCARSRDRAAFLDDLSARYAAAVQVYFDDESAARRFDIEAIVSRAHHDTHLYVCGPQGFMEAVLGAARAHAWPASHLHWEFFSGNTSSGETQAFDLQLARSGRTIHVPADRTALDALLSAGFDIPKFCGQGVCGTCLTRVLSGVPDHRDLFLTPEEQEAADQFLPCCSRSRTPRARGGSVMPRPGRQLMRREGSR